MHFFDIVVARSNNHVIGTNNTIPWNSKADLAIFKKITTSDSYPNILIMGRQTWESLPRKPLPNRLHIIISSTLSQECLYTEYSSHKNQLFIASSFENAFDIVSSIKHPLSKIYVIGGESIYNKAILSPWCENIYETVIDTTIHIESNTDIKYMKNISKDYYSLQYTVPVEEEIEPYATLYVWKRKLPIVWWIDESCYEKDWIEYLLSNIPHIKYVDKDKTKIVPNAVIITNQLSSQPELNIYQNSNTPYSLIHLSDEYLDDSYYNYTHSSCKQIFRNYYHPHLQNISIMAEKILTFGIGYRSNFSVSFDEKNIGNRPLVWSFAGYLKKSDRTLICKLFEEFKPYFVHETQGFHTGILEPEKYKEIMCQSKFVLCPIGNCSLDTFRIYEALEAGAIPVTLYTNVNQPFIRHLSNYWEHIFGKGPLPFLVNYSWEHNVIVMKQLLANPEIYKRVQYETIQFWRLYKTNLQNNFRKKLWNQTYLTPL